MKRLTYWLVIAIVYPLSYFPFGVLFAISDGLFFLLYRVLKYRRKVVRTNLTKSFPSKTDDEIDRITEQFYRYLCDLIVENIKLLSISADEVRDRFKFLNKEKFIKNFDAGNDMVVAIGHSGNWEFAALLAGLDLPQQSISFYRPQQNSHFDKLIINLRTRFGLQLVREDRSREIFKNNAGKPRMILFPGDQTPSNTQAAHWMTFLNQDTPVHKGVERISKMLRVPAYFGDIRRVGRGRYTVEIKLISQTPGEEPESAVVEGYMQLLEAAIKEQPENWLWSHRRWKHKRPESL